MLYCIFSVFMSIKRLKALGVRALPNTWGEVVTYEGIFGVLFAFFCVCMPSDVPRQITRTIGHVIMMLCREMTSYQTSMMSCHDVVMTS